MSYLRTLVSFTFHYVYIYIPASSIRWITHKFHLHSTMFIFIFPTIRTNKSGQCIYIPLCLYLYLRSIFVIWILSSFTFHYVYIYILSELLAFVNIVPIYIPLCLYLYDTTMSSHAIRINLHSTMFIFISSPAAQEESCLCSFTFHYVYIYIWIY